MLHFMEQEYSSLIGVRLVSSKIVGAEKHNEWRYIVMFLLVLFVLCGIIAIFNMNGFSI